MKVVATVLLGPGSENSVGDAVRSAIQYVDGFVLIGSGGGISAFDAVHDAVAIPDRYWIRHFEWRNDYGAARNFALDKAREVGADWALTLDPDERLKLGKPEKVRQLLETPGLVVMEVKDADEGYWKERFIRCDSDAKWRGPCCEVLDRTGTTAYLRGAVFEELPKTQEQHDARRRRGVVNMPDMIAKYPDEPRWRRHLASCLKGLGFHDGSIPHAQVAVDLYEEQGHREPAAWTRYQICESLYALERYEEAAELAAKGIGRHAGLIPEFGAMIAHCEWKRWENEGSAAAKQNAVRWAELALGVPDDSTRTFFRSGLSRSNATIILREAGLLQERSEPMGKAEHYAQRRERFLPDYRLLASKLSEWPEQGYSHFYDVGAGNGLLVEALAAEGMYASGCEPSLEAKEHTAEHVRDFIEFGKGCMDVADQWFPFVTCIEVLEHLPEESADDAVRALCEACSQTLIFSAAQPGQGGQGHCNEQPPEYWVEKFKARGFALCEQSTEEIREWMMPAKVCWWLARNLLVLRRVDGVG